MEFELELLLGVEGGEVVEEDFLSGHVGVFEVDRFDLEEGEVSLAILGGPDLSGDRVAGAEVEPADLGGGDVDVVGAGEVVVIGCAQEAEAVGEGFENAFAVDHPVLFRMGLQQGEDQLLFAHARSALHLQFLGQLRQFVDLLLFQLLQVHGGSSIEWVTIRSCRTMDDGSDLDGLDDPRIRHLIRYPEQRGRRGEGRSMKGDRALQSGEGLERPPRPSTGKEALPCRDFCRRTRRQSGSSPLVVMDEGEAGEAVQKFRAWIASIGKLLLCPC